MPCDNDKHDCEFQTTALNSHCLMLSITTSIGNSTFIPFSTLARCIALVHSRLSSPARGKIKKCSVALGLSVQPEPKRRDSERNRGRCSTRRGQHTHARTHRDRMFCVETWYTARQIFALFMWLFLSLRLHEHALRLISQELYLGPPLRRCTSAESTTLMLICSSTLSAGPTT